MQGKRKLQLTTIQFLLNLLELSFFTLISLLIRKIAVKNKNIDDGPVAQLGRAPAF